MSERDELLTLLGQAIKNGEFEVFFQPEFRAADGEPMGVETLIRWRHPQRGLVAPAVFLALCEDSGLILELGRWVWSEACKYHFRLVEAGWPDLQISMNVSASQFRDPGLPVYLRDAITQHKLPAGALGIELPESVVMSDPDQAVEVMSAIRELGVGLIIGDYGTGYSSMATLYRVPADVIKIDRSVVRGVPADANNAALCRSIISLAHGKSIDVIAEGVELREEHDWLRATGCDGLQGYLFAHPAPFEDMLRALAPLPAGS